ncbi:MAG: cation transporter [Bacteroidales bacterium]|nr:cation transporter [Bacteroidales bacterium]
MKTKLVSLMALIVFSMTSVMAQTEKKEEFKVYGNCGMCEDRIEKAAKLVDGVSSVAWDKETKMVEVSFDESKTNVDKIQKAIAKVGHDTDKHKAKEDVYNDLPGCCKYDRVKE